MSSRQLPDEWYYLDDSKAVGPFTRDVMRQLRNAGKITPETSVACAGQEGWKPLSQHDLAPVAIAVPVPQPRSSASQPAVPVSLPATGVGQINWGPAMVFQCVGCLFGILAELSGDNDGLLTLLCMAAVGMVVSWALLHSACWKALPEHLRFTTPQRAVGYMFIPFYNLYWAFISYPKLLDGMIQWQAARGLQPSSHLHSLALAMAIAHVAMLTIGLIPGIGSLIDIGSVVVFALFYKNVTEVLNNLQEGRATHV